MLQQVRDNTDYPAAVLPSCPAQKVLRGQTALVTGASSGIGRAIAVALGQAGADVVVNYSSSVEAAETIVEQIRTSGSGAIAVKADVSDETQVMSMYRRLLDEFGTIDILINNAGLQQDAPVEDLTLAQWNRVIGVNLTGQFLCTREAIREFKRRGVNPEVSCAAGKIICISSVHEVIPWAGHVNYAASKGGINAFIRTAALELARDNITVNGIEPGYILTAAMQLLADEEGLAQMAKYIPTGYMGVPEDIAYCMLYLASDEARYLTGQTICIDGGSTLPESPVFLEELEGIKELAGS